MAESKATRRLIPDAIEPNRLDAIRLVLALGVILSHCWALVGGSDAGEPIFRLTQGRITLGGICLAGFFLLSGFLVARSFERSRSGGDYLARRVRRIYPGYVVACLLTVLAVALFDPHGREAVRGLTPFRYLRDTLLLMRPRVPGAFGGNPLPGEPNGAVYTVQFEFALYLLLAGLGTVAAKAQRFAWPALALAFCLMPAVAPGAIPAEGRLGWWLAIFAASLAPFALGASLWHWRERVPSSRAMVVGAAVGLVAGLTVVPGGALRPLVWACGGYLLFAVAFWSGWRDEGLARYGDFSYGTYLYGFLVRQALVARLLGLAPGGLFALAAPVSLACGAASCFLVERPFLGRTRHRVRKAGG